MYNSTTIAERIKKMAKYRGVSIGEMLSTCGLGKNTVAKISNNTDILTLNFAKIADYLDCSVDYLLGRTDKPEVMVGQCDKWDSLHGTKKIPAELDSAGESTREVFSMYLQLDIEDQAEIRGEMRQMLKSDKYSAKKASTSPGPHISVTDAAETSDNDIKTTLRDLEVIRNQKGVNSNNSKIAAFGGYEKPLKKDDADRLAEIERLTMRIQELQDDIKK